MAIHFIGASPKTIKKAYLHSHSCWEIILNTEGNGIARIGSGEYPFSPGTIHIIPPNVFHVKDSVEGFKDIFIRTDHLKISQKDTKHGECFVLQDDAGQSAMNLMRMMFYRYVKDDKNDPILQQCYDLLLQLFAEKYTEEHSAKDVDPIVEYICRHLTFNFNDPELSATALLESTGYHRDYVRRRFVEQCGVTPSEFLKALRIEHAKKLLTQNKDHSLSMADIGEMCGYYDERYFSRVFKEYTGFSPSQFIS